MGTTGVEMPFRSVDRRNGGRMFAEAEPGEKQRGILRRGNGNVAVFASGARGQDRTAGLSFISGGRYRRATWACVMERETSLELATSTLARLRSTN